MNILGKFLAILALSSAASFSQQLGSTSKSVSKVSSSPIVAVKDDSQKQLKKVAPKTLTTWTKIKDLFM